jgi:hypothetical protein
MKSTQRMIWVSRIIKERPQARELTAFFMSGLAVPE